MRRAHFPGAPVISVNDPRDDPEWRTPAEACEYRATPDYAETMAYLRRIASAHPGNVRIENFGISGEGRDLQLVIASRAGDFDPESVRASGRTVLLVQNAIHAGEMDGKDACLALLRDLLRAPDAAHLLDHVVLLFIPIYNVDGHERRSEYNRINQNGPVQMGWRANASNLNLNRDYLKAEAPETRAFLRMFHRWLPDFFVDDHVTDGADFQYDVTFVLDSTADVAPDTAEWLRHTVTPELVRRVNASGHLAFPAAVFLADDSDPAQGLRFAPNPPRFSTGQMILEGRPGLLVELHMLKDYRTRVTANYAILRGLLEILHRESATLRDLNRRADAAATQLGSASGPRGPFPLSLEWDGERIPVPFRGYRFVRRTSDVSGGIQVEYVRESWDVALPTATGSRVSTFVVPPAGYIVPPGWSKVVDVLDAHGVERRTTRAPWTGPVERYRCSGMRWPSRPFEGHHPILQGGPVDAEAGAFGDCVCAPETAAYPAGSVVVPLAQRLSRVVIHWLEPQAPDSALRWGFFDAIFEQKEHGEAYVLERLARQELARDLSLRTEFEARVAGDPQFASDPRARLDFFYQRSPWGRANRVGEYPVARLLSLEGLPLG
jgi:murein tripeptide amidase MpaA